VTDIMVEFSEIATQRVEAKLDVIVPMAVPRNAQVVIGPRESLRHGP
jgi:hypothetical protein